MAVQISKLFLRNRFRIDFSAAKTSSLGEIHKLIRIAQDQGQLISGWGSFGRVYFKVQFASLNA